MRHRFEAGRQRGSSLRVVEHEPARLARRVPLLVDPERKAAVAELKAALANRELVLHYQPKTEVTTGRVVGAEGLVRWLRVWLRGREIGSGVRPTS